MISKFRIRYITILTILLSSCFKYEGKDNSAKVSEYPQVVIDQKLTDIYDKCLNVLKCIHENDDCYVTSLGKSFDTIPLREFELKFIALKFNKKCHLYDDSLHNDIICFSFFYILDTNNVCLNSLSTNYEVQNHVEYDTKREQIIAICSMDNICAIQNDIGIIPQYDNCIRKYHQSVR